MIPEIVAGLAGISTSTAAVEALIKAIKNYRAKNGGTLTTLRRPEDELRNYRHNNSHVILAERDYDDLTAFDDDGAKIADRENRVYNLLEQYRWVAPKTESPHRGFSINEGNCFCPAYNSRNGAQSLNSYCYPGALGCLGIYNNSRIGILHKRWSRCLRDAY
jgi:hypothetical protein